MTLTKLTNIHTEHSHTKLEWSYKLYTYLYMDWVNNILSLWIFPPASCGNHFPETGKLFGQIIDLKAREFQRKQSCRYLLRNHMGKLLHWSCQFPQSTNSWNANYSHGEKCSKSRGDDEEERDKAQFGTGSNPQSSENLYGRSNYRRRRRRRK